MSLTYVYGRVDDIMSEKDNIFEQYFNQYYLQVYKYILKKVTYPHIAEDLTMDAFVDCYKKFEIFDKKRASFATWLYVIVNNRLKNYYRERKIYEPIDEVLIHKNDKENEILKIVYLDSLRSQLVHALECLNETQRKIVIYKYFYERNSQEIAKLLGISSGNVRVQLSRSLNKIKEYLKNEMGEEINYVEFI